MNKWLFISLTLMLSTYVHATKSQEQLLKEFNKVYIDIHNKLKDKNLLEKINIQNSKINEFIDNPFAYDVLRELIATDQSFAGLHSQALENYNYQTKKTLQTSIDLTEYHSVNAIEAILKRAKNEQIIMVNEAHHITQHRVLSIKLLKGLWNQGYRYFAVEALAESGEIFVHDGYNTEGAGYYTEESIFSQMLLEAKSIGFKLISYDYGDKSSRINREISAADNLISKIFKENKNAKVLIHCGYSHIKENDGWLAEVLRQKTGIDPFTINQTHIVEQFNINNENPIYAKIINKFDIKSPTVIEKSGALWSASPASYDVNVILPRTINIEGRPSWATLNRKPVKVNSELCNKSFPCLIEVYDHSNQNALPSDRILLESEDIKTSVFISSSTQFLKVISSDTTEQVNLKELIVE